jgi:CubicO group peptidase (beta-lactamase class C family)
MTGVPIFEVAQRKFLMSEKRIQPMAFILICLLLFIPLGAQSAQKTDELIKLEGFEPMVAKLMAEYKIPGVAISIVKDAKLIYARGFGLRDITNNLKVTPDTLFAIGSCSKAFTAVTMGILSDEGKLDWDKPVREYLPSFRLSDPIVSERMRPRDLVTHRSGLPRHDLVWYKAPLSRQDLFDHLRYLDLSRDLRQSYQYNNLMFMTAGTLVGSIAGMPWEDFARKRVLDPLGMTSTNFSVTDSRKSGDFARPYMVVRDKVEEIPFCNIDAIGPAGSINSNVTDMAKWLILNLNKGKYGEKADKTLISENQMAQIHAPQMVVPDELKYAELLYPAYGMGWRINAYRGHLMVNHGGAIDGFSALVSFLPRDGIGVVILVNLEDSPINGMVVYNIYDRLLGMEPVNWYQRIKDDLAQAKARADKKKAEEEKDHKLGTKPSHSLDDYAGEFENPAYGIMTVSRDGDRLKAEFHGMSLIFEHYHYDVFQIRYDLASIDHKVTFVTDVKGNIGSLTVPFEASVKDIVFNKKPSQTAVGRDNQGKR